VNCPLFPFLFSTSFSPPPLRSDCSQRRARAAQFSSLTSRMGILGRMNFSDPVFLFPLGPSLPSALRNVTHTPPPPPPPHPLPPPPPPPPHRPRPAPPTRMLPFSPRVTVYRGACVGFLYFNPFRLHVLFSFPDLTPPLHSLRTQNIFLPPFCEWRPLNKKKFHSPLFLTCCFLEQLRPSPVEIPVFSSFAFEDDFFYLLSKSIVSKRLSCRTPRLSILNHPPLCNFPFSALVTLLSFRVVPNLKIDSKKSWDARVPVPTQMFGGADRICFS